MNKFFVLSLIIGGSFGVNVYAKSKGNLQIGVDGRLATALSRHFQKSVSDKSKLAAFKYDVYCYSDANHSQKGCSFAEPESIATTGNNLDEGASKSFKDIIFIATGHDEREFQAQIECNQGAQRCTLNVGSLVEAE